MLWVKITPKYDNATLGTGNYRCSCCNDRFAINGEFLAKNFNTEILGTNANEYYLYRRETKEACSKVLDDFIRNVSPEHYSKGLCTVCLDIFFKRIHNYTSLLELLKGYIDIAKHTKYISTLIAKMQQAEQYIDVDGFKTLARSSYGSIIFSLKYRDIEVNAVDAILSSDILNMEVSLALLDITCSGIVQSQHGYELSYVKQVLRVGDAKFKLLRGATGVIPKRVGVKHYYSKDDIEKMISFKPRI